MKGEQNKLLQRILILVAVDLCSSSTIGSRSPLEDLRCPKGHFLKRICNESNGCSVCKPCPPSTYMDKENNRTECLPCSQCGPSKVPLVKCQPTQNRKCKCPKGKFLNPHFLFCMSCSKCAVGEGMISPCTHKNNTKCQPCPKGTFSNKASVKQTCKKCSECKPAGITVLKEECTAYRDTICKRTKRALLVNTTSQSITSADVLWNSLPLEMRQLTSSSIFKIPLQTTPPSRAEKLKTSKAIYFIVGIVAVSVLTTIVFITALFFIVKKRRHALKKEALYPPGEKEVRNYHFPMTVVSGTPALARSSQDENGKSKMLVRDLPGYVIIELGRLLNPKSFNNWAKLAGHLGFTNNQAKNFELEPEEATQSLLNKWGQQDSSTVGVLMKILKEMKRDDCVQVLQENNNLICKEHTSCCIPSPCLHQHSQI